MVKILLFVMLSFSCASKTIIPIMENRVLFLSPDKPTAYYNYCAKRSFISKKCKKWVKEEWDLTDKRTREKLINMGFKFKVFHYR
jgi:hypothetical protein